MLVFLKNADFNVLTSKQNGTLCQASLFNESWPDEWNINEYQICNFTGLNQCYESEGSHSKTFWIYVVLRMFYQVNMWGISFVLYLGM